MKTIAINKQSSKLKNRSVKMPNAPQPNRYEHSKYNQLARKLPMNKTAILLTLLVLILVVSKSTAQENESRYFSVNYVQKIHFVNYQKFANFQEQTLPKLKNNVRFHGMRLEGAIAKNIIVGLYAYGSLNDSKNDNGYTSWGGGIGVVTIEYRYYLPANFFIGLGIGLGCGRFIYSSALWNGTESITSITNSFFGEPNIKIGYIFKKKLILAFEASYMFSIASNEYNVGAKNMPVASPNGWFMGGSIGYQFPFINRKNKKQ